MLPVSPNVTPRRPRVRRPRSRAFDRADQLVRALAHPTAETSSARRSAGTARPGDTRSGGCFAFCSSVVELLLELGRADRWPRHWLVVERDEQRVRLELAALDALFERVARADEIGELRPTGTGAPRRSGGAGRRRSRAARRDRLRQRRELARSAPRPARSRSAGSSDSTRMLDGAERARTLLERVQIAHRALRRRQQVRQIGLDRHPAGEVRRRAARPRATATSSPLRLRIEPPGEPLRTFAGPRQLPISRSTRRRGG